MSFIVPPGGRSRQPINFGARVNPRYMARPEMVWVGGRSIGDKNGNFTRGSSLTDVAHGEAGLGIQFTGSTTNAYTRSGGSTVAQEDCTFVSVFSWTSGAANYRPQLCSFSSANNSYRIGPTVDAGGDLALVLSGVVVPVSVSITSGVTYVLVTSRQKSTGNCYMVAKPLGGGAVARSVASNTSAALAGNGTSCVGYAFGGGSYAWNGNIYLVAGSYEWMPESLARELLDDPYSLFRAPRRLFAAASGATAYSIDAQPGSYSVTGADAGLASNREINAEPGSFSITGFDVTFVSDSTVDYELNAEPGSFTITGFDVSLPFGRVMNAEPGSFTITGFDSGLSRGWNLNAEAGSFIVTGFDTTLNRGWALNAEPGSFAITGIDMTMTYSTAGGGIPVTIYSGVSRAHLEGISKTAVTLTDAGGGTYNVTESPSVSENKTDSTSYEGYEY